MVYDIIIVGAGTAGLSAAIYGARAGKSVLVLEANSYGGQIIRSPEVENYPGIAHISGYEFAENLYAQATGLGAKIEFENVVEIRADGKEKYVVTEDQEYTGRSVILATGAVNRPLGVDREEDFIGAGVSYCATCDGAFFKGKECGRGRRRQYGAGRCSVFIRLLSKSLFDPSPGGFPRGAKICGSIKRKR